MRAPPATKLAKRITDELVAFIQAERPNIESEAHPLLDELEVLITSGGKRLRPRFCYWGHRAAGGEDSPNIIRLAASLEVLHTFALIHDDVMDQSQRRRNRLSTFRALAELSAAIPHRGDPKRFGASAAILTGLLGFVLADRLFYGAGFPQDAAARAADRYDHMRVRAIGGQYLDLLAALRGEADEATTRRIGELKSAAYTVVDPLAIGAFSASADDGVVRVLESYGRPLGEAFQLRDDILSVFGDPDVTGKDHDGDLREGKQTLLIAKARASANANERRVLEKHLGREELRPEDAQALRDVVVSTGALEHANALIDTLGARAKEKIDDPAISPVAQQALIEMADEVTERDA
jgi:geranylgeranyl diphosphate synthase type I